MNKLVFEDKIILYWDRDIERKEEDSYCVKFGDKYAYTDKTYYEINNVKPDSHISVSVYLADKQKNILKSYYADTIVVPKSKSIIDITKEPYFAVGDGKTVNTLAIQRAIDDCGKDDKVYIPQGDFLSGALTLHSDMEIFVDIGGILRGTSDLNDYLPKIKSRFEGIENESYKPFLNLGNLDSKGGYTARNVFIRGGGSILGGGRELMINTVERESGVPFNPDGAVGGAFWRTRGRLLQVANAENVVIENLTIGDGASWNLHFIYSKDIVTCGCKIVSHNVNNGDGWDPDSSENCTIFNCVFDTRDDMIAIKSGKNPEGNIINRPSKNIRIFDCRCLHGHGLAVGSEMSGGVDGVYVWDCDMINSRCGMEVKGSKERGGYVKNVSVYNSSFSILSVHSVSYNSDGNAALTPPVFENYRFENIVLTGKCLKHNGEEFNESAIILEGFDTNGYELKDVKLKDIKILKRADEPKQNITVKNVKGLSIENLFAE